MPTWTHIMIHHSAGGDSDGVELEMYRRWHVEGRGWQDVGYHAVAEEVDGAVQVLAGRPLYMSGAHCPGWNSKAIGLCLAGNFEEGEPPEDQLRVAAKWVAGMCFALGIPPENILRHRDHRATACPGKHFDLSAFRSRVRTLLGIPSGDPGHTTA